MSRRITAIRVLCSNLKHKKELTALGLLWHPEGKNGRSKHWFSIRLNAEQREKVKNYCDNHGLECEEERMLLDTHYMLHPGLY